MLPPAPTEPFLAFGGEADADAPRKKRQRLSLVCTYCKRRKIRCDKARPKCSSCTKLGIECSYKAPDWVNSNLQPDTSTVTFVTRGPDLEDRSREELYQTIFDLKAELGALKVQQSSERTLGAISTAGCPLSPSTSSASTSTHTRCDEGSQAKKPDIDAHVVNFYQPYNTLALKGSSHEDHKPLCSLSIHKKDHYQAFFTCYLMLTLRLNSLYIHDLFRDDYKSKHANGTSKWLLLLDTEGRHSGLDEAVQRIVSDRSELFRMSFFPFKSLNDSIDLNVQCLSQMVISLLPPQDVMTALLEFYFQYMWSHRPYVDKDLFNEEIDRIIKRSPDSGTAHLLLAQRSDFAVLASLLIILRAAYVAIGLVDDDGTLEDKYTQLKKCRIPVSCVTTAETCLCFYRISRKTTLPIVQAFLFLRAYHRDAPEDGDGITLFQSQNLFGYILQSALQMGLNRDPINYTQTANNIKEANLRRRLWHSIVAIDAYQTIFAGTISTLPHPSLIEVHFPMIVTVDPLEHSERDALIKDAGLNQLYLKLGMMVNNVKEKCNLQELLNLIHQTRSYVDTNYNLDEMVKLETYTKGSKSYLATVASNGRCVSHQIIQATLELQIYFSLCVNYESNANLNVIFYKKFFEDIVKKMAAIFDLCSAYLLGDFSEYTSTGYNFEILPLVSSALYRALAAAISGLLRCYHAQELVATPMYASKKAVNSDSFEYFIKSSTKHAECMIWLMKEKIAPKYYLGLKAAAFYEYALSSIKAHKFKPMNTIIKFLESNEKSELGEDEKLAFASDKRDDIKRRLQMDKSLIQIYAEWMQISNFKVGEEGEEETSQIVNIHNNNMFLEFTEEEMFRHINNTTKFKWSKQLPELKSVDGSVPFCLSCVPTFNCPSQDELQSLNSNGGLKSFGNFDFFESNITDDEYFGKLLSSLDVTCASGPAQQNRSPVQQQEAPQPDVHSQHVFQPHNHFNAQFQQNPSQIPEHAPIPFPEQQHSNNDPNGPPEFRNGQFF